MAVPSVLALTSIPEDAPIISATHRNNYAAVQTAVNALIGFLTTGNSGSILKWNGTDWTFTTNVTIDDSTSKVLFGSDTYLVRNGAADLKTNGIFRAVGAIVSNNGVTGQVQLSSGSSSRIIFDNDTYLGRASAGILTPNGGITVDAGDVTVSYDSGVANATGLLVKRTGASLTRVEVGASDSGGSGYRMLRIAN